MRIPSREKAKERRDAETLIDTEGVDRLVHEPARLSLMVQLSVLEEADFVYLMNETGLTRGNLSSHMSKLEDAGYITVDKRFVDRAPRTVLALTDTGRSALDAWGREMGAIVKALGY